MSTSVTTPAGVQPLGPGANRVEFPSEGATLVGVLHLPHTYRSGDRLPAIVVTGSWTTVKEQMAGLYARRMAEQGFAALAFDFRHWGESGGEPRHYESPSAKIVDIRHAVTFLEGLPAIDGERIGGLGICASAGYLAYAVADDARVRAVAMVAAWLHDAATVPSIYEGEEGVRRRVADGRTARERFERTGEVDSVPAYEPGNAKAGMFFEVPYYGEADRGAIHEWDNRFAVMSWPEWLGFDALAHASQVRVPTLFVHSDDAALPDNVRKFHRTMPGPKDLFWTEGQHIDFYDREPQITKAANAVATHFDLTLNRAV